MEWDVLKESVIYVICIVILFGGLWRVFRKDQAYLQKKTKEAISPSLREEIERERAENSEKKKKFEEAMRNVAKEP